MNCRRCGKLLRESNVFVWGRRVDLETIKRLKLEQAACRARLDFWEAVLTVDKGIRSPVQLWDRLNRLDMLADVNEVELDYLEQEHTV